MHEFAFKNRIKVYEINPKKSANFAKVLGNRSKTDIIDAKMLYKFHLLLKEDFSIPIIDRTTEQSGSSIHSYEIIRKTRTMLTNHLQSMEYREGVKTKLKESIRREVKHLTVMEENLEKEMEAFAENSPKTEEDFKNLLSIKGVGIISAVALLYPFKKYPDTNRSEITALAGLDPMQRQSGSSLKSGRRISRAGDPMLGKLLCLACMNSIQHNDRIKVFHKHLVNDNHKKPKVALVACMKKLLLMAHQIYLNKSKYEPLASELNEKNDTNDKNPCFSS